MAWMGGLARELVWVRAVWARAPAEAHQEKRAAEKAWKETRLRHHLRRRSLASARLLRLPLSIAGWHEKQATACAYTSPFNFCKELRVCHQTIQITAATNSSRAADTSTASSLFGAIPNIGWRSFMACDVTSSRCISRRPSSVSIIAISIFTRHCLNCSGMSLCEVFAS